MRYAVFSDIHGNLEALNAVMADWPRQGIDGYLCVGDIVGYGANPNECTRAVMDLEPEAVCGNHDRAVAGLFDLSWFNDDAQAAIRWTDQVLGSMERRYLSQLPLIREAFGYTLVHGSLADPGAFEYLDRREVILATFRRMTTPMCFVGHTHRQGAFFWSEGEIVFAREPMIELINDEPYLVNPGSVGQPRDRDPRAAYGIFDTERRRIELRRVAYNIPAAQDKIRRAGLPAFLADRLAVGH